MSEQKTGRVPDGYMPIPTAEQIADALENVRCFHDMSAELIAPELLANLLAVTTVKAEPAQCTNEDSWNCKYCRKTETCEALADKRNFGTPSPSLPAAVSADLTAVRCQCCATEYPHDSYDAGFIAGSGMCQVCDAAMATKDLPAAGSAVEEVEVVAWMWRDLNGDMQFNYMHPEGQELMTVAQHERIVAARDAAIEEWSGTAVQNGMEVDRLSAELGAVVGVLSAAQEQFNRYGERFPDGFDSRVFRWVDDAMAGHALSAQQSAHVSVPRQFLERALSVSIDGVDSAVQARSEIAQILAASTGQEVEK